MKPLIIGIAGGSASGKTSISRHIQEKFSDLTRVLVIRQDDYYKDQSHKPMSERIKTNYDHPSAFDNDLLVQQVHDLMDGKPIEKPTYDFVNHTRSDVSECCYPCDVLILEGLFILEDENLRNLLDIKVFFDTDADIRIIRRIQRDVIERARSLESVISQYMNTVKPMHEEFVEPSKKNADIIVLEGGMNLVAMDMIKNRIRQHLSSQAQA